MVEKNKLTIFFYFRYNESKEIITIRFKKRVFKEIKGFTLLEILIVIIIVGVLATIGFTQYSAVIERSRGAEARKILGQLRKICTGFYIADNNVTRCDSNNLSIGTATDQIPSACVASHYFTYNAAPGAGSVTFTATRCTGAAGKQPGAPAGTTRNLTLTTNYATGGTDVWNTNFGY